MDHVHTTGDNLDLDIDLESGGTTSGDDNSSKSQNPSCKTSKNVMGWIRNGFMNSESQCSYKSDGDCSLGSYEKTTSSDEITAENKEQLGKFREDEKMGSVNNEEKPKKHNHGNPCKPPRPPKGPSLNACDIKLMKELNVLNLKRKRMERRRLRKMRKDKSSSWASNIFACLLTLLFLLVIIFQATSQSSMARIAFLVHEFDVLSQLFNLLNPRLPIMRRISRAEPPHESNFLTMWCINEIATKNQIQILVCPLVKRLTTFMDNSTNAIGSFIVHFTTESRSPHMKIAHLAFNGSALGLHNPSLNSKSLELYGSSDEKLLQVPNLRFQLFHMILQSSPHSVQELRYTNFHCDPNNTSIHVEIRSSLPVNTYQQNGQIWRRSLLSQVKKMNGSRRRTIFHTRIRYVSKPCPKSGN
ncbi:hypothetical protein STAS_25763 [Striga asiatica]|uniref:Uncharacterized protein n=1 Tax=Striga asiatica TaxID=4170 RepID=A0A5A7QTC8_STRAF|nr:hypothetical protein STAS_25763 [Striga asiatica]